MVFLIVDQTNNGSRYVSYNVKSQISTEYISELVEKLKRGEDTFGNKLTEPPPPNTNVTNRNNVVKLGVVQPPVEELYDISLKSIQKQDASIGVAMITAAWLWRIAMKHHVFDPKEKPELPRSGLLGLRNWRRGKG